MINKLLYFVLLICILAACTQQNSEEETAKETRITIEDVEAILTEQGFELERADVQRNNFFTQELNGMKPYVYTLEGNILSVYVYPSASDRGKGIKRFEEKTAAADLVGHKAYGIHNILVFYISDDHMIQDKLFDALKQLDPTNKF
jgi:hypothetical protein